ncbi:hypothetical protein DW206_05070 [Bacteroides ovatus]|jgi:hypothetical protein|uniref:Uncharacterized protein n=1 Tax=Bacteroides ovatus TaxID=28116 RepID=A0A414X7H6_BACOV|nr:hypothetical protein DW206_05070 [Bacteroides ovatus]
MIDLLRNIIAYVSTFTVICITVIFIIEGITYMLTKRYNKNKTSYKTLIAGIIIALLLSPLYYLPA